MDSVLNNRVYVGDLVWFKSKKVGRDGRERTNEDDWLISEDAHEALVDRELFANRKTLAAGRRFNARRSKAQPVTYLLSRLIKCCSCGNNFVGRQQRKKDDAGQEVQYHRYYCGGYLGKGPAVCASLPIHKDWVENFVLDLLRHKLCEPGMIDNLERRIRERVDARRKTYGQDPAAVEGKLAEIDRRIANYYRAIGDGMDATVCQTHIVELSARKDELEAEASVLRKEDYYDRALAMNVAELRRFARAFGEEFETLPFAAKRRAVLYFVERVEVVDRQVIRVHFKVPFDNNGIKLLTDEVVGGGPVTGGNGEDADGKGALAEVHTWPATGSHSEPSANSGLPGRWRFVVWGSSPPASAEVGTRLRTPLRTARTSSSQTRASRPS